MFNLNWVGLKKQKISICLFKKFLHWFDSMDHLTWSPMHLSQEKSSATSELWSPLGTLVDECNPFHTPFLTYDLISGPVTHSSNYSSLNVGLKAKKKTMVVK